MDYGRCDSGRRGVGFGDIKDRVLVEREIHIAIAGGHNLLMMGSIPPTPRLLSPSGVEFAASSLEPTLFALHHPGAFTVSVTIGEKVAPIRK
jgi:hypothetical protein